MENLSSFALVILAGLPLAGISMLLLILLALGVKRDRLIVPGVILITVLFAGWGAAVEYGDQMKSLIQPQPIAAPQPLASLSVPAPPSDPVVSAPEPEPEPAPGRRDNRRRQPDRLVPVDVNPTDHDTDSSGRRRVVVAPPTGAPPARPATRPEPEPTPIPVRRVEPTPAPTPAPAPAPPVAIATPRPEPRPAPAPTPTPTGGKGTVVVKIKGPIIETATTPSRTPHLTVILDGKQVKVLPPTNVKEVYKDNNPNGQLLSVTYFWEDLTVTFTGVEAGFHLIQIDSSLDNPRNHQAKMLSSAGQTDNDYNGSIEVKAGATVSVGFGPKNWSTGQLVRTN